MQQQKNMLLRFMAAAIMVSTMVISYAQDNTAQDNTAQDATAMVFPDNVQLGPRPFYLVDQLEDGELKTALQSCEAPFTSHPFSIGHRGAAMQFPEHTRESYLAAARMGAGILECDVTFTQDRELVCRHSQCDLHTTTNILAIPELAAKCSEPFQPAQFDPETGELVKAASARCCTSDITLEEFKMLEGKMDAYNRYALTPEAYMGGTAEWRTDLYAASTGTLMTHAESIALIDSLGLQFTPELKSPSVEMPFDGDYSQEAYAQHMIQEYIDAGIAPERVWAQSFNLDDVLYWIENTPEFGKQAVALDGRYNVDGFDSNNAETFQPSMQELKDMGVNVVAPPMWMLVTNDNGEIVPSAYTQAAHDADLDIITWTLERSGPLGNGGGWYYQSIKDLTNNDGAALELLDVLAQDVNVLGVFSDWPATTTLYANCMLEN